MCANILDFYIQRIKNLGPWKQRKLFDICFAREYVKGIALFSLIEIIATRKRK